MEASTSNPTGCPAVGVEKLRNLPLLMCLLPMSGVILGTVGLLSSLTGGISGYALESSSSF